MWEGPPPRELRSFRSLSRASRASIRRKSRSSVVSPPTPTSGVGVTTEINGIDVSSPSPVFAAAVQPGASGVGTRAREQRHSVSSRDQIVASPGVQCVGSEDEDLLPYGSFPEKSLRFFTQTMPPRNWCLLLVTNPYPFHTDCNLI